jgi:hypothetical protein
MTSSTTTPATPTAATPAASSTTTPATPTAATPAASSTATTATSRATPPATSTATTSASSSVPNVDYAMDSGLSARALRAYFRDRARDAALSS